MKRSISVFLAAIHLAGCMSLQPIPHTRDAFEQEVVRVGDKVVVATTMGDRRFEVTSATREQLCGDGECVRAGEVLSIHRQEVNVFATVVAVVALVGLTAAIGVAASGVKPFSMAP